MFNNWNVFVFFMNGDIKFHSGKLELHNADSEIKMLKKTAEKNMVRV